MVRIGVFSDSHGNLEALKRAISHAGPLDYIIHCGDGCEDLEKVLTGPTPERVAVGGNCDFVRSVPTERVIEVLGRSILITHGHKYDVKYNYNRLFYRALELSVNIVVFGHTHEAILIENEGILLMNPGSVGRPNYAQKPSYGLLEIEHNILNYTIINFG